MPIVHSGYISQEHIANEVERAKLVLGPEVVRVRYNTGEDTSGDPAIYFRIVLTDSASRRETLFEVTEKIRNVFYDELKPYENWGLFPYFNFRNQSEQAKREGLDLNWT